MVFLRGADASQRNSWQRSHLQALSMQLFTCLFSGSLGLSSGRREQPGTRHRVGELHLRTQARSRRLHLAMVVAADAPAQVGCFVLLCRGGRGAGLGTPVRESEGGGQGGACAAAVGAGAVLAAAPGPALPPPLLAAEPCRGPTAAQPAAAPPSGGSAAAFAPRAAGSGCWGAEKGQG